MASHSNPVRAILFAFGANFGIALAKTAAAVATASASMVAEAIHSYADTANQLLLLLGLRRARKPADREHPLGYGKVSYFWSFIVAVMLFSVGGLFSVYEGWHKLREPATLTDPLIAIGVLAFSVVLEAFSMYGCISEVNKIRRGQSLWEWLRRSRNAELVVVFGEDLAALIGLTLALVFVSLAAVTGNGRFDAYGSIAIGAVLLGISVFVGIRVKSLLIGRSADPDLESAIRKLIADAPEIVEVFNVITIQMGPQVVLAAKIRLVPTLGVREAGRAINRMEDSLKSQFPEIGWCFVEPDVRD
jgi:cation diffusion facilitator family transporter